MRRAYMKFNIIRPVKVGLWLGGKDGEGAKLLLDFSVEYHLGPFQVFKVQVQLKLNFGKEEKKNERMQLRDERVVKSTLSLPFFVR